MSARMTSGPSPAVGFMSVGKRCTERLQQLGFTQSSRYDFRLISIYCTDLSMVVRLFNFEACIGVLGIQDICHFTMLSILLPGIWNTVGGGVFPGGGGGGTLFFSAYVGSDPASTVHPKKKYQKFQAPQKNI